jgi:hypothetical protein
MKHNGFLLSYRSFILFGEIAADLLVWYKKIELVN